jgi:soluble lytic murein transglycosylase-like protein
MNLPVALIAAALVAGPPERERWEHHGCDQPVRVSEFRELMRGAYPSPFIEPGRRAHRQLLRARLCAVNKKQARTMRRDQRRARRPLRRVKRAVYGSPHRAHLVAIARCESGGDPRAVSPDGTYRGKYQFDSQTWGSVGGSGDPAAAPELEQDYRADLLYDARGAQPWPVCGA